MNFFRAPPIVSTESSTVLGERRTAAAVLGARRAAVKPTNGFLHDPMLSQLIEAKAAFECIEDGRIVYAKLDELRFMAAFHAISQEDPAQLKQLFMKIDCNSDGAVSWEEFLDYSMQQELFKSQPLQDDVEQNRYVLVEPAELPGASSHREPTCCLAHVPKCGAYVSAAGDGSLRVWHAGSLRHELARPLCAAGVNVNSLALLSPSLAKVVVATSDRLVSFYDYSDIPGQPRWGLFGRISMDEMPLALAGWALAGGLFCLGIGDERGTLHVYHAKDLVDKLRPERERRKGREAEPLPPMFTAESKLISLPLHSDWISQITYVPGFKSLLTSSLDASIRVTRLEMPASVENGDADAPVRSLQKDHFRLLWHMKAPGKKGVHGFVYGCTSGRHQCAACGLQRVFHVWNLESGDLIQSVEGHRANVTKLEIDSSADLLLSLDASGEIRTWDFATLNPLQTIHTRADALERPTVLLYDGVNKAMITADKRPVKWVQPKRMAGAAAAAAGKFLGHKQPLVCVLYSGHFNLAISGEEGGLICVWDVQTGALRFRFEHEGEEGGRLTAMEFDLSGRRLVTGASDGSVRLWNFSSGELLRNLSYPLPPGAAPAADVTCLVHIDVGCYHCYASGGWSGEVWLWPDAEGDPRLQRSGARAMKGHTDDILCASFHSRSLLLATGSYNGAIAVWSLHSGGMKFALAPPPDDRALQATERGAVGAGCSVEALGFLDPEGKTLDGLAALVSCGADGCLRLWDMSAGGEEGRNPLALSVRGICEPGESLTWLSVSADNNTIATADSSGHVAVWGVCRLVEVLATRGFRAVHGAVDGAVLGFVGGLVDGVPLVVPLASWRAHRRAIVRLEHLSHLAKVGGLVTASADCSVRLWSLSGEQVGIFGLGTPWRLDERATWLEPIHDPPSVLSLDHGAVPPNLTLPRMKSGLETFFGGPDPAPRSPARGRAPYSMTLNEMRTF